MPDAAQQNAQKKTPACRSCGEPTPEGMPFGPFCSARCQNADLGAWFREEYRISREIEDTDLTEAE